MESYSRKPVNVSIGATLKVLTNTTVTLRCNAPGNPTPSHSWQKSESGKESLDLEHERPELTLLAVGMEDAGTYTCVASNKAGDDSASTTLVVAGKQLQLQQLLPSSWFVDLTK